MGLNLIWFANKKNITIIDEVLAIRLDIISLELIIWFWPNWNDNEKNTADKIDQ